VCAELVAEIHMECVMRAVYLLEHGFRVVVKNPERQDSKFNGSSKKN